jgi:hypothetical protein
MPWLHSMRRYAWLTAACCWLSSARAAEPLDLTWQAPPGCPQEAAVREQIRELVPSAMLDSSGLEAEGTISRVDSRFRLNLVLRLGDSRGERSIESDSCSDLAGAAAVALGLLLQSATQPEAEPGSDTARDGGAGATESSTATPEPPASTPAQSPMTPPDTTQPAARARSWRVALAAPELSADLGPLPKPSVGLALAAGVSLQDWLFLASFQLPRRQQLLLPGPSGAGAELEHLSLELWACRSWRASRFELGPCLIFGWERLLATGQGAGVSPASEQTSWVSFGAAATGRFYVADWLAITASAGAKLQGARPTIRIDGLDDSRRLAPAALAFRAGPMLIF